MLVRVDVLAHQSFIFWIFCFLERFFRLFAYIATSSSSSNWSYSNGYNANSIEISTHHLFHDIPLFVFSWNSLHLNPFCTIWDIRRIFFSAANCGALNQIKLATCLNIDIKDELKHPRVGKNNEVQCPNFFMQMSASDWINIYRWSSFSEVANGRIVWLESDVRLNNWVNSLELNVAVCYLYKF